MSKSVEDKSQGKKPVVFISSALSPDNHSDPSKVFEFFVIIAARLSIELRNYDLDLIIKVPRKQGTAIEDQNLFLKELIDIEFLYESYSAIIIAPFDTDKLEKLLAQLIDKNNKSTPIPILTVDKQFDAFSDGTLSRYPHITVPPCVVCDGEHGGRLAARSLFLYCLDNQIGKLNIVLMEGLEGSKQRIGGFESMIDIYRKQAQQLLVPQIYYKLKGNFERKEAELVFNKEYLNIHKDKINGIFCCNDEMALGVRDAIYAKDGELKIKLNTLEIDENKITSDRNKLLGRKVSLTKPNSGIEDKLIKIELLLASKKKELSTTKQEINWINNIKIVGYDAIPEVKFHMIRPDDWLLDSVDVQIHQQVIELTKMLHGPLREEIKIQPKVLRYPEE